MRTLSLILLICILVGCRSKEPLPESEISCNATDNYAKTINEASARLLGSWKLVQFSAGLGGAQPVPEQVVIFRKDGNCVITSGGRTSPPISYALDTASIIGNSDFIVPQLAIQDSSELYIKPFPLGKSLLFICDEEMVLDYGSPLDGSVLKYRKVAP